MSQQYLWMGITKFSITISIMRGTGRDTENACSNIKALKIGDNMDTYGCSRSGCFKDWWIPTAKIICERQHLENVKTHFDSKINIIYWIRMYHADIPSKLFLVKYKGIYVLWLSWILSLNTLEMMRAPCQCLRILPLPQCPQELWQWVKLYSGYILHSL